MDDSIELTMGYYCRPREVQMTDMKGRVCVVTGANTGIGKETARGLAQMGAHVILACRSEEKARAAIEEIQSDTGNGAIEFHHLDLSSLAAVRESALTLAKRDLPLHVLVNNAGLAGLRGTTVDGWEMTMGVNHLGPFLWTLLLLDKLKASAPSRMVMVASQAHKRINGIDFDAQTKPTQSITGFPEYCVSKLANVLFSRSLGEQLEGTGVTTYSVHPGGVASDIFRKVPQPFRWVLLKFLLTNEEGAQTSIYCATDPELADVTGLYYAKSREKKPAPLARDDELAKRVWDFSEQAVKEFLDP